MAITFALPSALLQFAGGRSQLRLDTRCGTVGDALHALAATHAGVVERVLDEQGEVRRHVNVFVDGENVRFLEGLGTALADDSTIVIFPAVSGG
jgi:molybdopterin synthase sulfur carrier subunit